ncbi:MAG: YgdI/YgdR family lipoprotein [Fimbriimonadaceae bacterium]|nr:YgdI/YgdR family lipoprotein [Fimbriimonadaceae bacterium]
MKFAHLILAISSLALLTGCGRSGTTVVTGPDGAKVTTDAQGNATFTDDKGNRVDVKAGQESWTAKSSNGSEATVSKDGGITGQTEKGEKFSMDMAGVTEKELGLPFYPGSTPLQHRDMKVDADGKHVVLSVRATKDSPAKVIAFYKTKVDKPAETVTDQIASMGGTLPDGGELTLSAIVNGTETEISVNVTRK